MQGNPERTLKERVVPFSSRRTIVKKKNNNMSYDVRRNHRDAPLPSPHKYAGEVAPPTTHVSTNAVSGFTGHLPGVANTIGARFPTTVKMSKSYTDGRARARATEPRLPNGLGRTAVAPTIPPDTDRWGNFTMPHSLTQELANVYLQALHPSVGLDATRGVGRLEGQRDPPPPPPAESFSGAIIALREKPKAGAPVHIQGYTGYRQNVKDLFGDSFHRTELKATVHNAESLERPSAALGRGTYEAVNFSAPRNNRAPLVENH